MIIPESVRIGGINYKIVNQENLNDGKSLLYGQIDFGSCEIRLSTTEGTADEHRCITLLHEILHGITEYCQIELDDEEKTIAAMARGLFQVINDNPDMF